MPTAYVCRQLKPCEGEVHLQLQDECARIETAREKLEIHPRPMLLTLFFIGVRECNSSCAHDEYWCLQDGCNSSCTGNVGHSTIHTIIKKFGVRSKVETTAASATGARETNISWQLQPLNKYMWQLAESYQCGSMNVEMLGWTASAANSNKMAQTM